MRNVIPVEAKKWDETNPAMNPVEVPYGRKAVYRYQQPIVCKDLKNLPENYLAMMFDGWGIVTVQSDHVMTLQEKEEYQKTLKQKGASIIGNMRLTKQIFTRDKNSMTVNNLGDLFENNE